MKVKMKNMIHNFLHVCITSIVFSSKSNEKPLPKPKETHKNSCFLQSQNHYFDYASTLTMTKKNTMNEYCNASFYFKTNK